MGSRSPLPNPAKHNACPAFQVAGALGGNSVGRPREELDEIGITRQGLLPLADGALRLHALIMARGWRHR